MESVKIEYLGHASFRLEWKGQRIVLDPYADGMIPGLPPLRTEAEFVFCSHEHADHNAVDRVKLKPCAEPSFVLQKLVTDHDDAGGSKRGGNLIHLLDFGGIRVAHFGDLGRMLTDAEFAQLQGVDCIMIPVGGFYTIDSATAAAIAEWLQPRIVIPMHFRRDDIGFDVLEDVDEAMLSFDEDLNVIVLTRGGYVVIEK